MRWKGGAAASTTCHGAGQARAGAGERRRTVGGAGDVIGGKEEEQGACHMGPSGQRHKRGVALLSW